MNGLLHIYTGDGKGKTTAALGLLLRTLGTGGRAVLVQFLKGRSSGEIHALSTFGGVTILQNCQDYGFIWNMTPKEKMLVKKEHDRHLAHALRLVAQGQCDLLVLDESIPAYLNDTLDKKQLDDFLHGGHGGVETVLTGRNAPEAFIALADYVTELKKIRHPFDQGVPARKGIEF